MHPKHLAISASLALLLSASAHAADAGNIKRWYRYYNEQHSPSITDAVTAEHLKYGYDVLDRHMQVIQRVPAAPNEKDLEALRQAKLRKEQAAQQAIVDAKLLQLYATHADAERTRDRQLEALQLKVDFLSASVTRLRQQRAVEAQRAAGIERSGRPIPKDVTDGIKDIDSKIVSTEKEIKEKKAEISKVQAEFAPVIQRLKELRPATSSPAAAEPATAATP